MKSILSAQNLHTLRRREYCRLPPPPSRRGPPEGLGCDPIGFSFLPCQSQRAGGGAGSNLLPRSGGRGGRFGSATRLLARRMFAARLLRLGGPFLLLIYADGLELE